MALAFASPAIRPASHSPRSMPADTPAAVTIRPPASTMRSSPTGSTPNVRSIGSAAQCDVARLPSSSPAAARITDPEHTDVVHCVP